MPLSAVHVGRLLIDPPSPGPWNMAVDEVLLENADQGELCLRFYAWLPTTLSLGYFQRVADRQGHLASRGCPIVRRASGGGAIVHDDDRHELTYSLAVPGVTRARHTQRELYEGLHQSLIGALASLGVSAQSCAGEAAVGQPAPFLCFQRHTEGDVMIGRHKVAGSAQRRLPNAVLQHGTVLLSQSPGAPELLGIAQVSSVSLPAHRLREVWLERLATVWPVHWQLSELTSPERQRARQKVVAKFDHASWSERR